VTGAPEVLAAVKAHHAFIIGETLARRLDTEMDLERRDVSEAVDIDGLHAVVSLVRYQQNGEARPRTAQKKASKSRSKTKTKKKKSTRKKPGRKGK